jgi:hypothetical protein
MKRQNADRPAEPLFPVSRIIWDPPRFFHTDLCCRLIFPLNGLVHLAAVDRHLTRRFDAQPHLVAAHVDDRDDHIVADDNALISLPGKHKHELLVALGERGAGSVQAPGRSADTPQQWIDRTGGVKESSGPEELAVIGKKCRSGVVQQWRSRTSELETRIYDSTTILPHYTPSISPRHPQRFRPWQAELHRMIVPSHNLPAQPRRQVDYQRRLKIQDECALRLADDYQHLRLA